MLRDGRARRVVQAAIFLCPLLVRCATSSSDDGRALPNTDAGEAIDAGTDLGTAIDFDHQPEGSGAAHLTGQVVAPEGTIPVSGVLVYVTSTAPTPVPDQVYCDQCVDLPFGTPFTYTDATGHFDLEVSAGLKR